MPKLPSLMITRVENGMGLVMPIEQSKDVDPERCVTFSLTGGSELSLTPEDASRLNKGLEGLLMVPFTPALDCGCADGVVCRRNGNCPRLILSPMDA